MIHRELLTLAAVAAALLAAPASAELSRFGPESMEAIERAHAGEPFLAIVWSIDCAPCRAELALLADLAAAQRALDIVLIATDDVERAAAVEDVLAQYSLPRAESWIFADGSAERLRHAIDPEWFGEMPRAYFYGADSSRVGASGALTRDGVLEWLEATEPRP